jgi:hypothetical protein
MERGEGIGDRSILPVCISMNISFTLKAERSSETAEETYYPT